MMEDFRYKSCGDGRMQIDNYYGSTTAAARPSLNGNGMQRSSVPPPPQTQQPQNNDAKFKKGKQLGKVTVKGSFKKSFRWIKDGCSRVVFVWR
ncbi:hypothetical protein Patl1_28584 [Pistacia atlantica]|uniref:Uncharacterized protein n=1 Tax=Pistacia atlantica TaxID=434234 RepID=A0ACC1BGD7_9ROSI|nr:hypothetical protein Patl1_28584 [Pistacia atlantica]